MSSRQVSEVGKMAVDAEPPTTSLNRKRSRSSSTSRTSHSRHYHSRRRSRSGSRSRSHRHKKRSRSRSRSRERHSRRHRSRSKSRSRKERTENYSKSSSSRSSKREVDEKKYEDDMDMPLPPEPPKISQTKQHQSHKSSSGDYENALYDLNDDGEPIDKERIHREMEEKLRQALAREGKVYPPKKPEASHPVFANDGSFIEIFKKMQEQAATTTPHISASPLVGNALLPPALLGAATPTTAPYVAATATGRSAPPPPLVGRRRGGKILKTGVVAKQRVNADASNSDPKDFWALYLAEVNKYKNTACETETGNRPLVK